MNGGAVGDEVWKEAPGSESRRGGVGRVHGVLSNMNVQVQCSTSKLNMRTAAGTRAATKDGSGRKAAAKTFSTTSAETRHCSRYDATASQSCVIINH